MSDRVLAEVHDYDQLMGAFRARVAELDVPGEAIDAIAGLPLKYTMKLLAPKPVKAVGRTSLGPLLGTLGLKLLVVEDVECLAKIIHRLVKARSASASMRAILAREKRPRRRRYFALRGHPELARLLAQRRILSQSPGERSAAASYASRKRWKGHHPRRRRRRGGRVSRTSQAAGPRARR